jgi:hypothetical protein
MDAPSKTCAVEGKKPLKPCSRCPHRLVDIWAHQTTPEPRQPTSKESATKATNNNYDNVREANSTAAKDQVDDLFDVYLKGGGPEDACDFCNLFPPGFKCPLCAPRPPYSQRLL